MASHWFVMRCLTTIIGRQMVRLLRGYLQGVCSFKGLTVIVCPVSAAGGHSGGIIVGSSAVCGPGRGPLPGISSVVKRLWHGI